MNAIAQQSLLQAIQARITPAPAPRFKGHSRDADKFVIRLPESMRDLVKASAENQFTSMNSFVLQAIAEKLDRDQRQDVLLSVLTETLARIERPAEVV